MVTVHSIRFKLQYLNNFVHAVHEFVFLIIFAVCVNSDYSVYTVNMFVFVMKAQFILCVLGNETFCVTQVNINFQSADSTDFRRLS